MLLAELLEGFTSPVQVYSLDVRASVPHIYAFLSLMSVYLQQSVHSTFAADRRRDCALWWKPNPVRYTIPFKGWQRGVSGAVLSH